MSENSEKDKKAQVTSKGVSGTKELKAHRISRGLNANMNEDELNSLAQEIMKLCETN